MVIPDVPDPEPNLGDRLAPIGPWVVLGLALAAIAAWVVVACRLTRTAAADPPSRPDGTGRPQVSATVAATLLLAAACQTVFAAASFYESHREMPLATWHLLPMLAAAALLLLLAVVRSRSRGDLSEDAAVTREAWWLTAIVALAIVLRTYALDRMPPGFFQDEATNGNDAIAMLALDSPAIWSDSVGGRPTLFLYLLGFVLQHAGVSYLSLKVVPVFLGVAGVVAVYAVGRLALGPRAALWAAFLLAVSRWDIHYSRMAWEAICVPLFSAAGFALLLAGLRDGKRAPLHLILAALVLTGGIYTYAAYRAVPAAAAVFLVATLLSSDRQLLVRRWRGLTIAAIVAAAVAAPLLRFGWEQPDLYWYRYSEVSLTRYMEYYATPLPWLHQFGKGLLSLTSVGDELIRHNLPWAPHLDRITGGLMLIGMTTALALGAGMGFRLLWCWFVVFMLLGTLTMDGPHATRLLGVAPAAVLFAGFGITRLLSEIGRGWGKQVATASAVGAAVAITGLNTYEYFVLEANHPAADLEYDATGRSLCEQVRLQDTLVDLRWSDDLAYWASGQCEFLARGKYMLGAPLRLPDVLPGNPYESGASRPTLIAIGPEFIDLNRQSLAFDEHGVPKFSLPGEPSIARNRAGHLLYYLYRIALPPPSHAG